MKFPKSGILILWLCGVGLATMQAQVSEAYLVRQIATAGCPCYQKIDLQLSRAQLEAAGAACLQDAFGAQLRLAEAVYGSAGVPSAQASALGEAVAMRLLEVCEAFAAFSVVTGMEAEADQLPPSLTVSLADFHLTLQTLGAAVCVCLDTLPARSSLAQTADKCLNAVLSAETALEKKIAKSFGVREVAKITDADYHYLGEAAGLVLFRNCPAFRQRLLAEIRQRETAYADSLAWAARRDSLLQEMQAAVCDCFAQIPDGLTPQEADAAGENCLVTVGEAFESSLESLYFDDAPDDGDDRVETDFLPKLTAELTNCNAFLRVLKMIGGG